MFEIITKLSSNIITILTLIGLIITIFKNPFKTVKKFFAEQKENENNTARLDKLEPDIVEIKNTLNLLVDAIEKNDIERIKHNVMSFATDVNNGVHQPSAQWEYIIEKCGEYTKKGHNGKLTPYIDIITKSYDKMIKED